MISGEGNSLETVQHTMDKIVEVLQEPHSITAVLACNDLMALGLRMPVKKAWIENSKGYLDYRL